MTKHRIIHICLSCFYADGMGYQENILPKKHFEQGNVVEIITSTLGFDSEKKAVVREVGSYTNENGITVIVLPFNRLLGKLSIPLHYVSGLFNELCRFSPDIIFCHGLSFLSIFDLERYCRTNKNVKLFFDCHSDYFNTPTIGFKYKIINGIFWPLIAHTGEKYCEVAWGTTPARCEYLKKTYGFSEQKVGLLVMGGDEDLIHYDKSSVYRWRICEQIRIPYNSFIICSGGKIDKNKKILELIEAVKKIGSEVELVVFGSVMADVKERFYQMISGSEHIHYLGWLNQVEIYNCFLASDLAVFPGTHSVLWEQAVATGIPTIFRRRPMMEHIDVGGNCLFFEDDSVDELYSKIKSVVYDKPQYEKMRQIAETKGKPFFSYASIAKRAIGE